MELFKKIIYIYLNYSIRFKKCKGKNLFFYHIKNLNTTYVSFKPDKVGHKNSQKSSLNTTYVSFKLKYTFPNFCYIISLNTTYVSFKPLTYNAREGGKVFKNNPLLTLNLMQVPIM